jgi:hypothetical protein
MIDAVDLILGSVDSIVSIPEFGFIRLDSKYSIADIPIDTFKFIDHTSKATPTKYPVESGAWFSDHIVIEPVTVKISGLISDVNPGMSNLGIPSILYPISDMLNQSFTSRTASTWNQLKALQTSRIIFAIDTGIEVYENMCITLLSVKQDKDSLTSLRFFATCQEILVIDMEQRQNNLSTSVPDNPQTEIGAGNGDTDDRVTPPREGGEKKPTGGSGSGSSKPNTGETTLGGWFGSGSITRIKYDNI